MELLKNTPILCKELMFAQCPVTRLFFSTKNYILVHLTLDTSESPLTLSEAYKHASFHSSSSRHFGRRQSRLLVKIIIKKINP